MSEYTWYYVGIIIMIGAMTEVIARRLNKIIEELKRLK